MPIGKELQPESRIGHGDLGTLYTPGNAPGSVRGHELTMSTVILEQAQVDVYNAALNILARGLSCISAGSPDVAV
jgi:hypothetical protein